MHFFEARNIAARIIKQWNRDIYSRSPLALYETAGEYQNAWLFSYQTVEYFKTLDRNHVLIENVPILISKTTGKAYYFDFLLLHDKKLEDSIDLENLKEIYLDPYDELSFDIVKKYIHYIKNIVKKVLRLS